MRGRCAIVHGFIVWLFRRVGLRPPPRRLATCAVCYTTVFDDDDYCLHRGEACHRDCVRYTTRR